MDHGVADMGTARYGLVEPLSAAAEEQIHVMIDRLFRDGSRSTEILLVGGTAGHVLRSLARAIVDVRVEHGRRGIGELRGRDVAGPKPRVLRQLELLVFDPVAQAVPLAAESVT